MPKKSKVGKQRKDKFYKLAKETGYRSRASFKLLQLNRKFEFLPKCRILIDLCAAPGGWLQVARQSMPVSSVIIGVDIVPIKPIPNVITLQEDITTDSCRQALKKELKTWKADVVLNDGAPNVGKSWLHDAFLQNQLTVSALKLASEMLVRGGWFVTKVFRSKDYLGLIYVFKKFFKRVHVTKPQASRNESAEIFVICQGYLAPDHIDERLLDPSYVLKDVPEKNETKAKILQLTQPKKKAEGYDDEAPVYCKLKASEFIFSENHLEKLSKAHEIVFDDDDIKDHKLTTEEIKQCCKDIKVLGRGDLRSLLNWRKQMRQAIKGVEKKETSDDAKDNLQEEEQEIDKAVKAAEELELSMLQEAKKKKKKILKERRKLHERLNLKMIIKDDEPIIQEDRELFRLSQIKNKVELNKIEDEDNLEFSLEPPQPEADDILQPAYRSTFKPYNRYVKENLDDVEEKSDIPENIYSSDDDLSSEIEFESDDDAQSDNEITENILEGKKNPLVVDLVERPERVNDTVERWFDKEEFADTREDSDLELDILAETYEKKRKLNTDEKESPEDQMDQNGNIKDSTNSDKEKNPDKGKMAKKRKKRVKLDPEGLALGAMIIESKKKKRDIIESAYNRYASNDANLPDWFIEDEKKHYKKQLPVTAEMVAEYKARLKEINARPIRKVVEAKARKKRRAMKRLEKAKKKAEKITDCPDMSAKEKAEQLKTIYKKAFPEEDKNVTYIVAKKGTGRRVRRPAGVKGRFKVVDPRMKKDARKQKMLLKSQKKPMKKNIKKSKIKRKK